MKLGLAAALAVVAGCAVVLKSASPAIAAPSSPYAPLIQRVVAARGLKPITPIIVVELNDEAYGDAQSRVDRSPAAARSRAFLNPKTSVVYTRGAKDEELAELIVTALQNQHFSLRERLNRLGKVEAADALEGFAIADASLARLLMTDPTKRELATHVAQLSAMSAEKAVAARRLDPAVLAEPEATIRLLMIKQSRSLALVTRLYLAGGWELVNRAWEHPPTRLQELADAKSYVDGSQNPVALPAIPEVHGAATVENVVGLSVVQAYGFFLDLLRMPRTLAKDSLTATLLAEAQRGMSVRIVERPGYGRAFVLVTAWESPQAAERFVARWLENKKTASDCGPIAKQSAHAVVATLCLGDAASEQLIQLLLPKIGPLPAAQPPLGPLTLPKLDAQ